MARGFLSGVVWGTVVGGLGLGTLSVMTAQPAQDGMPMAAADKVEAVVSDAADTPAPDTPAPDTPAPDTPTPEPASATSADPIEAPMAPEVGDTPDALPQTTGSEGPSVAVESEAPVMPAVPEAPEEASQDAAPEEAVSDAPQVQQVAPEAEGLAEEPEIAAQEGPSIGTPATVLTEREGAVTEQRLPTIGAEPEPEVVAEAEPVQEAAEDRGQTALEANAAVLDVPANLPRMAVVLIDDGSGPLGPDALQTLPFPVTFAIDPAHPDPSGTAAAYRELGFEVAVIADLPEGGAATDVEIALAGALDQVPQAVAVIENPLEGFGGNRQTVTQVAQYLAASGHGLVMVPRGLNTAAQLAAREGVPATSVFRDFDADGQDANAIRRILDQAAFRARQDGEVVMLGRLRADTISALLLWGLQDRSGSLALVPASKVLLEAVE